LNFYWLLKVNRNVTDLRIALEKNLKNDNKNEFSKWKMVYYFFLSFKILFIYLNFGNIGTDKEIL